MAKEAAIGKKIKISEAQQYMLLSVFVASIFLGAAIALILHFVKLISFNTEVIMAQEQSISTYSNIIKETGICKSPSGAIYSDEELQRCNPESIEISEIPGTLRANILEKLAANDALNSVPNVSNSGCINPSTGEASTYKEMNKIYQNAKGAAELQSASQLIKSCSALRVIPDALPAFKNEEALLASVNKIFNISNWSPQSISPSNDASIQDESGLNQISVNINIEANPAVTTRVLDNLERSIREFNFDKAHIEWSEKGGLSIQAEATSYYINKSAIVEDAKIIKSEGTK